MPTLPVPRLLFALVVALFVVFVGGLLWLSTAAGAGAAGGTFGFMALLAFAAGLSMIVLPCTLPLVFVIVPLAASKDYAKGFRMALLFGLGLTITITAYGVAMAALGKIFGIAAATPTLLVIAGLAAYLFGLSELGFFRLRLPFFETILPVGLQRRGDSLKSFALGLLLGNAGVGCPNPLFYVLLFYIAGTENLASGALLGFLHGAGRALPVLLLALLALFGVQATRGLAVRRVAIERVTAVLLLAMGAFLVPAGLFNLRGWWVVTTPVDLRALALAGALALVPLAFSWRRRAPRSSPLP